MSLDKALKNLKFDVRMTDFNLNNSVVTKEEIKAHMAQLPDSADNSEKLDLDDRKSSQENLN